MNCRTVWWYWAEIYGGTVLRRSLALQSSVGAGLLANPFGQSMLLCLNRRVRQQAGAYRGSARDRSAQRIAEPSGGIGLSSVAVRCSVDLWRYSPP